MSGSISKDLDIHHSTVFTLCQAMDNDGMVFAFDREVGKDRIDGFIQCEVWISHAGIDLLKKGGYYKRWKNQFVVDFPKTFWWIVAVFSFWAGKDFKCGSKKESTQQVQQLQQGVYIVRDTCLGH